jgi:hypothetical protein
MPEMMDLDFEWKNKNWLSDGEKQRLRKAQCRWDWKFDLILYLFFEFWNKNNQVSVSLDPFTESPKLNQVHHHTVNAIIEQL